MLLTKTSNLCMSVVPRKKPSSLIANIRFDAVVNSHQNVKRLLATNLASLASQIVVVWGLALTTLSHLPLNSGRNVSLWLLCLLQMIFGAKHIPSQDKVPGLTGVRTCALWIFLGRT